MKFEPFWYWTLGENWVDTWNNRGMKFKETEERILEVTNLDNFQLISCSFKFIPVILVSFRFQLLTRSFQVYSQFHKKSFPLFLKVFFQDHSQSFLLVSVYQFPIFNQDLPCLPCRQFSLHMVDPSGKKDNERDLTLSFDLSAFKEILMAALKWA